MSYDNSNRGALWIARSAYSGRADVNGETFALLLVATGREAPSHYATLVNREHAYTAAMFKPKSADAKSVATGVFEDLGIRANVFKVQDGHERSPSYTVSFRSIEDQTPVPSQEDSVGDPSF